MLNPIPNPQSPIPRRAFTLVEILTATTLTLIMMASVITIFGSIGSRVSDSRSTMELAERLRATAGQLQRDLEGITVTPCPSRIPENDEGYLEIVEGPRGLWGLDGRSLITNGATGSSYPNNSVPVQFGTAATPDPVNPANSISPASYPNVNSMPLDSSVGDNDDILMFTTRSTGKSFSGQNGGPTTLIESPVAEVAWFVRGHTLYRRVLLVAPAVNQSNGTMSVANVRAFYDLYDISAHYDNNLRAVVANTLGDLTKRENRFAHPLTPSDPSNLASFPYDVRQWSYLGLPTMAETTLAQISGASKTYLCNWTVQSDTFPSGIGSGIPLLDYWTDFQVTAPTLGGTSTKMVSSLPPTNPPDPSLYSARWTDDIIMTNVIGFDVKVWDPGAPVISRTVGSQTVILTPGDPGYFNYSNHPGGSTDIGFNVNGTVIGYGAYVDLGYPLSTAAVTLPPAGISAPRPQFNGRMAWAKSSVANSRWTFEGTGSNAAWQLGRVYDTWSEHYNRGGTFYNKTPSGVPPGSRSDLTINGYGSNGFDDTGKGIDGFVDDPEETELPPPYAAPLRAVQVKIRAYDPGSRQIREVTVVQDFLPE